MFQWGERGADVDHPQLTSAYKLMFTCRHFYCMQRSLWNIWSDFHLLSLIGSFYRMRGGYEHISTCKHTQTRTQTHIDTQIDSCKPTHTDIRTTNTPTPAPTRTHSSIRLPHRVTGVSSSTQWDKYTSPLLPADFSHKKPFDSLAVWPELKELLIKEAQERSEVTASLGQGPWTLFQSTLLKLSGLISLTN